MYVCDVFFFKQKTAYEMRISDWSSDVCSSDLRGWNESGPTKIYLRALRSSVMSLHEVSEVEPGSGFLVRDLIRGGEPLRVSERSASQTLKQWDRIGARVVQVGGKHLLSGGVLSFTMEAAEALVADLRRSKRSEERRGGKEWVSTCRSRWCPYH